MQHYCSIQYPISIATPQPIQAVISRFSTIQQSPYPPYARVQSALLMEKK